MPRGRPRKNKTEPSETSTDDSTLIINSDSGSSMIDNALGPTLFNRDDNGLLNNIQYLFNEDGSVNWRGMVKEDHLFPNKAFFERFSKPTPKSIDGLKDHQLLIKLGGIKELARVRGFNSVSYETVKCEHDHVAVKCKINFSANYETGNKEVTYEDMANASYSNCSSFAVKFLETIACNRSFVRCVRNFLNVHIVGMDEMDTSDGKLAPASAPKSLSPSFSVQISLEKNSKSLLNCEDFDCFKDYLNKIHKANIYHHEDVPSWEDYSDIPSKEARILLKIIKDLGD
ncbi:MAG: hypothetical protein ACJAT2_003873 [Bacteriovoracaceae bacterium]|jgi:hypothetical protein